MLNTQCALVAATVAAMWRAETPVLSPQPSKQHQCTRRSSSTEVTSHIRRLTSGSRIISSSKTTSSGEGANR
jgi:hypothetical protein